MYILNIDETAKSPTLDYHVFPEKAGIQLLQWFLDPGFLRGDDTLTFYRFITFFNQYHIALKTHSVTPAPNA